MPFAGLRGIKPADLPREVAAGVTLAAMIIPLNIGFAQVAGLPPTAGLYAGIIPLVLFAIFTSSRQVVASPDAPITALLAATLAGFAAVGDPLRLQYTLAIALLSGLLFFVFWFFRLAFLANFLSRAVLAGFISGLGIEVFTNQVRRALGVSHAEGAESGAATVASQIQDALGTTGYFAEVIALIRQRMEQSHSAGATQLTQVRADLDCAQLDLRATTEEFVSRQVAQIEQFDAKSRQLTVDIDAKIATLRQELGLEFARSKENIEEINALIQSVDQQKTTMSM